MTNTNLPAEADKPRMIVATEAGQTQMAIDLGDRFGLPAEQLTRLVSSLITVPEDGKKGCGPVTPAELVMFLSTCRQYDLNPIQGQVHGWRDSRGKMNVMIAYDGWVDYANRQPGFKGVTYEYGDLIASPDGNGRQCWEWIKATVHTTDRGDLPQVPIYLEEWYVPGKGTSYWTPPWQDKTKHKFHVVDYRLAIREVYGFGAGTVIDEDQPIHQMAGVQPMGALTEAATAGMVGPPIISQDDRKKIVEATKEPYFRSVESVDFENNTHEEQIEAMERQMSGEAEPVTKIKFKNGATMDILPVEGEPLQGSGIQLPLEPRTADPNFCECDLPLCALEAINQCLSCGKMFCLQHCPEGECAQCREGE